jgi:PTH1 family peptidyl-tRNA hydrolase
MSSLVTRVVVGLGNPGERYARTRHNAGFMVVDALAGALPAGTWSRQCRSLIRLTRVGDTDVLLIKPQTLMNRSGEAIRLLLEQQERRLEDVLLVVDDFELPFGRIRIRKKGSAGGHNGLESVIRTLGTAEFMRVRLGIGEESMPSDKADFVLEDFPPARYADLKHMILRAADAVKMILTDGVSRAMAVFNA